MPNYVKSRITFDKPLDVDFAVGRVGEDKKTVWLNTPYLPPLKSVLEFAKEHPELSFKFEWADEDSGWNVGRTEYKYGMCTSFKQFQDRSPEAYELSFELWGNADKFRFNEETGTYEYKE